VCEREDVNRTRAAGHLDEIQGVVANTLKLFRNGAVGFIVWLDPSRWSNIGCGVMPLSFDALCFEARLGSVKDGGRDEINVSRIDDSDFPNAPCLGRWILGAHTGNRCMYIRRGHSLHATMNRNSIDDDTRGQCRMEGHQTREGDKATHRSNETEISHGKVSWQAR